MYKRHVDLAGLPHHLHNRLKWDQGTPALVLESGSEPLRKEIEHWAVMNNIPIIIVPSGEAAPYISGKQPRMIPMSKGKKRSRT